MIQEFYSRYIDEHDPFILCALELYGNELHQPNGVHTLVV